MCPLPVGKPPDVTHTGTGTEIRQEEPSGSNRTRNRSRVCLPTRNPVGNSGRKEGVQSSSLWGCQKDSVRFPGKAH